MEQWLLFEHEDGRYAAAPGRDAAFAAGDPRWHRVGPVAVALPQARQDRRDAMSIGVEGSVAAHLEKILQSEELGSEFARCSTTEAIMVALALCDRRYLPASLSAEQGRGLWQRLDRKQQEAIALFGQQAG